MDCCVFTASVVQERTGKDLLSLWKTKFNYDDYTSAMKTLKELNSIDLSTAPTEVLGIPRKPISEVKYGDIVYKINERGQGILGICNGVRAYFLQETGGITARNIEDCLYCWTVE